jgi:hypothetical protein
LLLTWTRRHLDAFSRLLALPRTLLSTVNGKRIDAVLSPQPLSSLAAGHGALAPVLPLAPPAVHGAVVQLALVIVLFGAEAVDARFQTVAAACRLVHTAPLAGLAAEAARHRTGRPLVPRGPLGI